MRAEIEGLARTFPCTSGGVEPCTQASSHCYSSPMIFLVPSTMNLGESGDQATRCGMPAAGTMDRLTPSAVRRLIQRPTILREIYVADSGGRE